MKAIRLLLFPVMLLVSFPAVAQTGNYTVKGVIKGASGKWIYLKPAFGTGFGEPDSVFSPNGEFIFKGKFKEKMMCNLAVEGVKLSRGFILEKGIIEINGEINNLREAIISGSPENAILSEYMAISKNIDERNNAVITKLIDAKKKKDSLQIIEYQKQWEEIGKEYENSYSTFIQKYPKSFVSILISHNHTWGVPELASKFLSLTHKSLQKNWLYRKTKERAALEARIGIGKLAPDFTQMSSWGETITLSSLKGKYVLLDFWASWCVPCRKESPNLVKIYGGYKKKGLEIVSYSLDEDMGKWLKAIEADGYSWINVSDLKGFNSEVVKLYGVTAIPKNFLLDKEGNIIAMNLLGEALNRKLNDLLK